MSSHPGESVSIWMDSIQIPDFPSLETDLEIDVCIVGAGLGGLTTAYLLMKAGKKVAVLEDHTVGSGQSGRTTAHFSSALDDRYFNLEKYHGEKGAFMAAQSHASAIEKVEEIVRVEKINCELERVSGYLFNDDSQPQEIIYKELEAIHRAGLLDVHVVSRAPLESFDTGPALIFPRQLQLHPMKYMAGLAKKITEGGGLIFTKTHVQEVHGGKEAYVKTKSGYTVRADEIVVATNTPINDIFAIHTKQAPYRTYVIGLKIPRGSVPKGLYWDTLDPYHYIRVEPGEVHLQEDILIVGGEDHKTGQNDKPEECYSRLETWARMKFPMCMDVAYKWSGQVMEPVDGMAFLGHNPMDRKNVYVITGDSGNGMTHCTIGAMLIRDQILGIQNPWESLYNPSRITLKAIGEFVKENANVAAQYGEWFTGKSFDHIDDIPLGEGAVVRDGLDKIAAYKDENGEVELYSAACPHLGGVVRWNSAEKSWDCPCHGSRFNCHGKVMEGPAVSDLKEIQQGNTANPGEIPLDNRRPIPLTPELGF